MKHTKIKGYNADTIFINEMLYRFKYACCVYGKTCGKTYGKSLIDAGEELHKYIYADLQPKLMRDAYFIMIGTPKK